MVNFLGLQVFDDKNNFLLPKDGGEIVIQDLTRIRSDHNDEKLYELIRRKEKESRVSTLTP